MLYTGIDILEISRIERSLQNSRFKTFVYGVGELKELEEKGFPPQSAAALFAAKEAFGKALGIGIKGFSLSEVEILHESNGRPYFYFTGNAKKLTDELSLDFSISISHSKGFAVAIVIGYSDFKSNGVEQN